eukprot:Gb_17677 [translate_table: standard]
MLAASSMPQYLKSFAVSMNTSLVSCKAKTIDPQRKNLVMYEYPIRNKVIT